MEAPADAPPSRWWRSHRFRVGVVLAVFVFGFTLIFTLIASGWVREHLFPRSSRERPDAAYKRTDYEKAMRGLADATSEIARFDALADAAKTAVYFGTLEEAEQYARELLETAATERQSWNYGNAIHDGHSTLGLVALRRGQRDEAAEELLLAGETPGSPQLDSFGPNMLLARELFEAGERSAVLQYLELCRRFWENERGRLQSWSDDVRAGRKPDFGANPLH